MSRVLGMVLVALWHLPNAAMAADAEPAPVVAAIKDGKVANYKYATRQQPAYGEIAGADGLMYVFVKTSLVDSGWTPRAGEEVTFKAAPKRDGTYVDGPRMANEVRKK